MALKTASAARVYHIPDADLCPRHPGAAGEVNQRGDGAPVALADGDHVEVRRAPVLDERRAGVPTNPPVEFLDVRFALPAGGDEVAFLLLHCLEANEVFGGLRTAERTAQSWKHPAAPAHVTREPTLAGVGQVAEAGRRAAVGTDAEIPTPLGEMDPAPGEVPIERRPERAVREEARGLSTKTEICRQRRQSHTPPRRKEGGGADPALIPCPSESAQDILGLTDRCQKLKSSSKERLHVFREDRHQDIRKQWNPASPTLLALRGRPAERRHGLGRPLGPRLQHQAVRRQRLAEGRPARPEVVPLLAQLPLAQVALPAPLIPYLTTH